MIFTIVIIILLLVDDIIFAFIRLVLVVVVVATPISLSLTLLSPSPFCNTCFRCCCRFCCRRGSECWYRRCRLVVVVVVIFILVHNSVAIAPRNEQRYTRNIHAVCVFPSFCSVVKATNHYSMNGRVFEWFLICATWKY